MKKKIMTMALTAALLMSSLAGCGSDATTASATGSSDELVSQTDDDSLLARIKERGTLIVGTASGYPPYEFVDITSADQSVIGIDMALAKAIADELEVELVIEDMTFSSLLAALPAKKIDIAIAGIAPTDERKETMDFSDSYLFAEQSFLILKANESTYATMESFNGQPLAAQKSTTQEKVCQDLYPDSQLVSLDKVPDCIMELKSGNVAGVCIESIVGQQYIISDDELTFSAADLGIKKETAVAIEKGNEDLLEIINKVIAENMENGNFDKWITEYSEIAASNAAG